MAGFSADILAQRPQR